MQAQNPEVSGDKATTPPAEQPSGTQVPEVQDAHCSAFDQRDPDQVGCHSADVIAVVELRGDYESSPSEALHHVLRKMHEAGRILSWAVGEDAMAAANKYRGRLTTCPTCFEAVPADRAHLLESEQAAIQWTNKKPTEPGAYWVRGFRVGEQDYRPALVEVARNEAGTLLCNMNDSNTNDDLREWSCVEDLAERFEWCGPLGVKTSMESSTRERELTLALDLAIRSLDQLVPYLGKVPADVGLLNEALMAGRKALQGGAV